MNENQIIGMLLIVGGSVLGFLSIVSTKNLEKEKLETWGISRAAPAIALIWFAGKIRQKNSIVLVCRVLALASVGVGIWAWNQNV